MYVYRVEDRIGAGPYHAGGLEVDRSSTARHPSPRDDGLHKWKYSDYENTKHYFFGFESMQAANNWFGCMQNSIIQYNREVDHCKRFGIATYECNPSDVEIGGSQLVFKRENAQIVSFKEFGLDLILA